MKKKKLTFKVKTNQLNSEELFFMLTEKLKGYNYSENNSLEYNLECICDCLIENGVYYKFKMDFLKNKGG